MCGCVCVRYRRKRRNQTPQQVLKRYRGLLAEKVLRTHTLRAIVLQLDDEVKKEFYDLDSEIREWRGSVKDDNYFLCDGIVEFVDLQLENNFYHPTGLMETVTILYKGSTCEIQIPMSQAASYKASCGVILLKEFKLYYWQYGELLTDRSLKYDLVYTKRCNPKDYTSIELADFLDSYSLCIEQLL